jgi:hypothetical protein
LFVSVSVILILLTSANVLAWNAAGHMMVAKIAYDRLNNHAKSEVDKLMAIPIGPADALQSKDFINASHWADDIKGSKTFPRFDDDHFVDYPFSGDGTALPKDQPKPENIVKALKDDVQILKTSSDDKARAQALRFIIHFVGDIHQPLHAETRVTKEHPEGDRGGNDFRTDTERLHGLWDGGIDTFPRSNPPDYLPPQISVITPFADQAIKENPDTDPTWKTGGPFNFDAWAKESFELSRDFVYKGLKENSPANAEYNKAAIQIVHRRIAWGGYRLAALLNAIWS